MTDAIADVAAEPKEQAAAAISEESVAEQLVAQAREKGIELVGPTVCSPISPGGCWRPR
jgi:hypothetical protein